MTSAAYRLVHFSPDPATGMKYPIAAVVNSSEGTRVEFVSHLPGAKCIGGEDRVRVLHRIQQRLARVSSFSQIPSLGPYVSFDEPHEVPEEHLSVFLRKLLTVYSGAAKADGDRRPSRRSEGMKWFTARGVARFVHGGFQPGTGAGTFLKGMPALEKISHYAGGMHTLMLMEPLFARPQFDKDVRSVAQRLAAYQLAIPQASGPDTRLYAYALPGLGVRQLDDAKRVLEFTRTEVVDVGEPNQRERFLGRIRSVATELLID